MPFAELMTRSKEDLAKAQARSEAKDRSNKKAMEALGQKLCDALGMVSAGAATTLCGMAEGRVRNRDGSPLSLGPCPLPLAAAAVTKGVSLFWDPGRQLSYASAGLIGYLMGTTGRGWGAAWRAKATGSVGAIGCSDPAAIAGEGLNDDEADVLFGGDGG